MTQWTASWVVQENLGLFLGHQWGQNLKEIEPSFWERYWDVVDSRFGIEMKNDSAKIRTYIENFGVGKHKYGKYK